MNANVLVAKKGHIPFLSARKVAREHFRLSFTQTYILSIIFIACLGVYYIWLLNQNATKGFNIRTLQVESRELAFKENLLDIRIAQGKSIDAIMQSPIVLEMENVENPNILVQKDTSFTMNH
ncbi:hypothetical protein CSB09_01580 [Candidatus Gracilibacteria bacterium]|nr:MAG: hypothetical protein CSB09_01580 [Candidatus Gracilibacteria bacterium]